MNKHKNDIFFLAFYIIVLTLNLGFPCSTSADEGSPIGLNESDRILILAPHPDDETIGTGGIIQRAIALNIPLKVVYLTNGDNNELSFLIFKKHPVLSKKGLLKMGEVRQQESVDSMASLGLKREDLVFLGYPDFGTLNIFLRYWDKIKPFKNALTRCSAVPYADAYSPGAPFKGESILNNIEQILLDFKPTKIFVTLPADTNGDHRAFYLFLQVALWDLKDKISPPEVLPFVVHVFGWPRPRGYHPDLYLPPPNNLNDHAIVWHMFELTDQEIEKKKGAIKFFKSQNSYNPAYLYTFARKNELFGRYREIILKQQKDNIDWERLEVEQNIVSQVTSKGRLGENIIKSITYTLKDETLLLRFKVNKWTSELAGINIFLIGYRNGAPFSTMPKIRLHIDYDRFVKVYDQSTQITVQDMQFNRKDNEFTIEFPLVGLGNPDYILTSARTYVVNMPLEVTTWRVLTMDHAGGGNSDQAPLTLESK